MTKSPGADWITPRQAADLLGVQFRTVYALIDRGQLRAEVTVPPPPKRRPSVRLRRQDVDDYIRRARIKPGELEPPGRRARTRRRPRKLG